MPQMMEHLSRRDFLFYSGATAAGLTLGEAGRRLLARADEASAAWVEAGRERWTVTTCRECPAACGMRVRLVNDLPVKLEGNPLCPVARGRLCAKGQASLEGYFDPDRLVGPARRAGARDGDRFDPITWPAAIAELAGHLRIATSDPGEQPIAIAAEEHGPLADAWARFWTAAGARIVWTPAASAARLRALFEHMTGVDRDPVFDVARATYLLSLGAGLAEDWLSPLWAQRAYGRFRRGVSRSRGRLVHVSAHQSATARKADEWFAATAEQQVVLAYGLASVILRENRAADTWPEDAAASLPEFERAVIESYLPDVVASVTGIPVVTLLRLARDLSGSPRPLVIVAADASPALVEAAFALNLLVGAFDRPGGVFASPAQATERPDDAPAVLREIAAGRVKPRLIALGDASALRAISAPADMRAAFERVALVVSFSPYLDEAAVTADLLMPTHAPLESWHATVVPTAIPAEAVAVTRPAVAPRLDTQDPAALLRQIADATGGQLAETCSWRSSEDLVATELHRLYRSRRGSPYSSSYETDWLGDLERGGWWVPIAATAEEFTRVALDAGGWLDPFFEPGAIRQSLRARRGARLQLPPANAPAVEPRAAAVLTSAQANQHVDTGDAFPLRLVAFVPAAIALRGGINHPALFELLAPSRGSLWGAWAEINPETAHARGIGDGDTIVLTSRGASIEVKAVLVEGMAADTVAVAYVPANPQGGRWWRLVTADVRHLWEHDGRLDRCFVRVARA